MTRLSSLRFSSSVNSASKGGERSLPVDVRATPFDVAHPETAGLDESYGAVETEGLEVLGGSGDAFYAENSPAGAFAASGTSLL